MKSIIISIALLLCFVKNVYSQESRAFLLGVSFGPSFPTGKLGSKSTSDTGAGWAKTGITAHLSGTYQLNKTVGISVVAGFGSNKEDEEAVRQALLKANPVLTNINASTGSWKMLTLLAGPALRLPLSHSGTVVFTAKATAGVCKTYVPGYHYSAIISNPPGGVIGAEAGSVTKQSLPLAFCYAIQPTLAFLLMKGVYLTGAVSYSGTASQSYYAPYPTSVFIVGNTTPGQPVIVYAKKDKASLAVLSAEVGIEVKL